MKAGRIIIINGVAQDTSALNAKLSSTLPDWESTLYQFILSYIDEKDTVTAHTSGTTGTPKAIALSKAAMRNSALMTGRFFGLEPGMRAWLCLPATYIAGKMMAVRAIELGLDLLITAPESNPMAHCPEGAIDFSAMVPMQVQHGLAEPDLHAGFSRIKQLIIGGGAVSEHLRLELQNLSTACYATYGMTETVTHVAVQRLNGEEARPDFLALPGVKIWQDDRQCLTITAPDLAEGTLVTNDVVELTDFSRFRWLGRHDNVINSGGIKIMPEQVEKKLESTLDRRYFIAGEGDDTLGERVVLVIEGEAFDASTHKLFEDHLNLVLERFERPKAIYFRGTFEETSSGKVKRIF